MSEYRKDRDGGHFLSDCTDIWVNGPADYTVRPIPPERIEQARALRDQIRAAEEAKRQQPPTTERQD